MIAVLMMLEAAFARYQVVDTGMPAVVTRHAPLVALAAFAVSWVLLHRKFELASYDFFADPKTDFLSEEPTEEGEYWYAETHRVSVVNHGYAPITVSVRLRGITPEPPTLTTTAIVESIVRVTEKKPSVIAQSGTLDVGSRRQTDICPVRRERHSSLRVAFTPAFRGSRRRPGSRPCRPVHVRRALRPVPPG